VADSAREPRPAGRNVTRAAFALAVAVALTLLVGRAWDAELAPEMAQAHLVTVAPKPSRSLLENRAARQAENMKHSKFVCRHGAGANQRWHCAAKRWINREWNETMNLLRPATVSRRWGPQEFPDSCLRELSRRETAGTYSPTIWNYAGSGAYGIGQALPASKMAPYGADYMTNPWTQLRWMIAYVNERYGGSCAALTYHNRNGSY
jgi:hypothetical protein